MSTARYTVEILPAALRAIQSLPRDVRERIRVGDCRVAYRVEDQRLLVVVVAVGHRREIYR